MIASKPPCHVSGISKQQREAKEKEIFNQAIAEIANLHWNIKEASFDGYPVVGVPIECKSETNSDHDMVSQFLKAPLKAVREGKFDSLLVEYKFLLSHVRRHHNEFIFLKCESSTYEHCSKHPVRATESFSFLKDEDVLPPSKYTAPWALLYICIFLEMCNNSTTELPTADQHLPSLNKELGSCPQCPE